jgi:catechol 2,3-dioxygenase-like lactoylglutathione lyase family enzyme
MSATANLKFSHMGLYVHDLVKMEDFYTRLLGFVTIDRGSLKWLDGSSVDAVFLSTEPDVHHQVILATGRPEVHLF